MKTETFRNFLETETFDSGSKTETETLLRDVAYERTTYVSKLQRG